MSNQADFFLSGGRKWFFLFKMGIKKEAAASF